MKIGIIDAKIFKIKGRECLDVMLIDDYNKYPNAFMPISHMFLAFEKGIATTLLFQSDKVKEKFYQLCAEQLEPQKIEFLKQKEGR